MLAGGRGRSPGPSSSLPLQIAGCATVGRWSRLSGLGFSRLGQKEVNRRSVSVPSVFCPSLPVDLSLMFTPYLIAPLLGSEISTQEPRS